MKYSLKFVSMAMVFIGICLFQSGCAVGLVSHSVDKECDASCKDKYHAVGLGFFSTTPPNCNRAAPIVAPPQQQLRRSPCSSIQNYGGVQSVLPASYSQQASPKVPDGDDWAYYMLDKKTGQGWYSQWVEGRGRIVEPYRGEYGPLIEQGLPPKTF